MVTKNHRKKWTNTIINVKQKHQKNNKNILDRHCNRLITHFFKILRFCIIFLSFVTVCSRMQVFYKMDRH
jgi:hypothetical protein